MVHCKGRVKIKNKKLGEENVATFYECDNLDIVKSRI